MKRGLGALVLLLGLLPAGRAAAQPAVWEALRAELLAMGEADQAIRNELIARGFGSVDSLYVVRQDSVDAANISRLREIIRRHGWPSPGQVGKEAAEAAFLVVQHARHEAQQEMLPLLRAAYAAGDVTGQQIAALTDRVLVRSGQCQRYGTHASLVDGALVIDPIEDEEHVDERRAKMGMGPLDEYVKLLEEAYGMEVRRKP